MLLVTRFELAFGQRSHLTTALSSKVFGIIAEGIRVTVGNSRIITYFIHLVTG